MNEYKVGKDVGQLLSRVQQLEEKAKCSCGSGTPHGRVTWQACFYEQNGQYAGSAIGDYDSLDRQCANWKQLHNGSCTFHQYPYNCPQHGGRIDALKPIEIIEGAKPPHGKAPCITFFSISTPGYIGIRNSCAECKIAVIYWTDLGIAKYKVPPYFTGNIKMESLSCNIIGEDPCP